jgi:sterol desaturase/sphingolipid hydroxylase (fatty acid hydroxylase superfamily)
MSWVGFTAYGAVDAWLHYKKTLADHRLPTRHPMVPFWGSQLKMVPIVLYNQLVVWPLTHQLVVYPIYARRASTYEDWGLWFIPALLFCMVVSDFMWYWGHVMLHTPYAWPRWHRDHHTAPQCALSATFVHPVEYTLFTIALNLPAAIAGIPPYLFIAPMGWGMLTGGGAHSGYGGGVAQADQHNAHHLFHNVNFGMLMIADAFYGTEWKPGQPPPKVWPEGQKIWEEYPEVTGADASQPAPVVKEGGKIEYLADARAAGKKGT